MEDAVRLNRPKASSRDKWYPSTLKCNVAYALAPTSLSLEIVVRNVGGAKAPLIVGAHPYFIVEGSWLIRAEGALRCLAEGKIPTGVLVPHEFGEDGEYDDCFLIERDPLVLESKRFRITVIRRGMPYVQIYTGVRRAIAVEPMSGAPDAYHNGMGLKVLSPDEEARFGFTIEFE
ncbi:MAG: aldose 1-epimerase [Thermoproteus sp.]|nr:aldose 1-epimerase [Thermoproteus sp.]